ncbi:response regulator [bacterium]|nr:response regulator [bacterium]
MSRLMVGLLVKQGYTVETAEDGEACIEKVGTFRPDLIILDIMMPKLHGLDALKRLKADPETRSIGVMVCSAKSYKPDLDHAHDAGAAAVIVKPFEPGEFIRKIRDFFSGVPSSDSAGTAAPSAGPAGEPYLPALETGDLFYRLWGTRGSVPVSGQKYARHGGNTSCMELSSGDDLLVFDAGTGIRELGMTLVSQKPRRIHIFVTHTHWDHIQGFPFFIPAYVPGFELIIYGASGFGKDLKSIFRGQLDRDYFPVQIEDMRAGIEFRHLDDKPVRIGRCSVTAEFTHHPGATVGYKIEVDGKTIVYASDNEFLKGFLGHPSSAAKEPELLFPYQKLIRFASDADVLIGESQYLNDEYRSKIGWGHSSLSNGCLFAKVARVKRWIVTHHDPLHDDDFLQRKLNLTRRLLKELDCPATAAHGFDGMKEYL